MHKYKIELVTITDIQNFVNVVSSLPGKIMLTDGSDFCVNAKSLLGVLSLGIAKGMTVTILADGQDEEAAIDGLEKLINSGFAE